MSHFKLLVITEHGTTEELEKALQPFHEYECTGIKDEFVVWVDHTEEANEDFKKHPEYATVEEYAKDWHGYEIEDGKIGRWTNPNRKWDWWVVGGRYENAIAKEDTNYFSNEEPEKGNCFQLKELDANLSAFAVLNSKGEWLENGDMGWWGCVSDEKNKFVWKSMLFKALAEENQEYYCTVVDCHI